MNRGAARHAAARPLAATSTAARARPPRRSTSNPSQLKSLITDFNTTAGAFAAREHAISRRDRASCRARCAPASPALDALERPFPTVRALARGARPGVRSSGPTIDASAAVRHAAARPRLASPSCAGWRADLRPTVPSLASSPQEPCRSARRSARASSCQNEVILPWTQRQSRTRTFPTHGPVYQESAKSLPGSPARAARATPTASGSACSTGGAHYAEPRQRALRLDAAPDPRRQPAGPPHAPAAAPGRAVRDPAAARPAHERRPGAAAGRARLELADPREARWTQA